MPDRDICSFVAVWFLLLRALSLSAFFRICLFVWALPAKIEFGAFESSH